MNEVKSPKKPLLYYFLFSSQALLYRVYKNTIFLKFPII